MIVYGFNPRPSRKRGATRRLRVDGPAQEFQSSPLSQEGRYASTAIPRLRLASFNPRPSRKRGATLLVPALGHSRYLFQSSPLSQEGRYRGHRAEVSGETTFQSSPLSQEGRYTYTSWCGID